MLVSRGINEYINTKEAMGSIPLYRSDNYCFYGLFCLWRLTFSTTQLGLGSCTDYT
jgi:hypothetical protein